MEIRYKYRIADAVPEDFLMAVDPSRLILEDKTVSKDGRELSCDVYDETGVVTNRITFEYDESGNLVKQLDYVDDLETPYKQEVRKYSGSGKLLSVETFYGDEPGPGSKHRYDNLDRLTEVVFTDGDGEKQTQLFTYTGNNKECSMQEIYHGTELIQRTTFTHNQQGQTVEELVEEPLVKFSTFLFRYYWNNEVPNNVAWEKYNELGDFVEECREVCDAHGNVLKRSWHTDDAPDSHAYHAELFEYNAAGVCVKTDELQHGGLVSSERVLVDEENRIIRKLNSQSNQHSIICYRYETQE